ncbi:RDD family protein [uncultured Acetobacteroides sp.]|uniref:RDD family protein n=1 Tax=uncultured Acetobacteroides sp. TaxID=1760811 RepID=UPI0029F520FD|nr:RDD family protein [uncultured Acetobacteroides sp.]
MKNTVLVILLFFKRGSFFGRLIVGAVAVSLLFFIFIPDIWFGVSVKNPKRLSIEEICTTPADKLPLYFIVDKAQPLKVMQNLSQHEADSLLGKVGDLPAELLVGYKSYSYLVETRIKNSDTTFSGIYYPVYSEKQVHSKPNALASDLVSHVIIHDTNVGERDLDNDKYFKDSLFQISGKFDGVTIGDEPYKLLTSSGFNISRKAIVLDKGSQPLSITSAALLILFDVILVLLLALSLLPLVLLFRIFKVEPADDADQNPMSTANAANTVRTPANTVADLTPASTGKRVGAFAIDIALINIVLFTVFASFNHLLVFEVLALVYFVACDILLKGSSLGKYILSVQVSAYEDGEALTMPKVIIRNVVKALCGLMPLIYLIAFLNEDRQALHDKAAGSIVVDRVDPLR